MGNKICWCRKMFSNDGGNDLKPNRDEIQTSFSRVIKSTKFVPAYDEGARERRRTKKPIAIRILEEINKIKSEVIILGGVRVLEVIVDR